MVTHYYQCSKSLEEKPLLVQNTQQEKKQHQTLQSMHPQTASKKAF